MTLRKFLTLSVLAGSLAACATSPLGRQQFLLLPADQMDEMGVTAYSQMKDEKPLSSSQQQTAYVSCVTTAITSTLEGSQQWEVNLFQDDSANAFALPGGKIGVNTGLLKVANNQSQLATVIGHEIGHVQAQHSNERMSLQYATERHAGAWRARRGRQRHKTRRIGRAWGWRRIWAGTAFQPQT